MTPYDARSVPPDGHRLFSMDVDFELKLSCKFRHILSM